MTSVWVVTRRGVFVAVRATRRGARGAIKRLRQKNQAAKKHTYSAKQHPVRA
jgi:hypothetical protein